ncbi:MAG: M20/M25/M40 family metallo-hydrolase [Desulfopila sp.]|jgi:tripeptide aminopeptidase|nr:M20/M25/M40 family metallo-hydrolase [Desulfopila sp.]
MQVNRERLAAFFTELCSIESFSRNEGKVAQYLQHHFSKLGADAILMDESAAATGSDCGNLVIRLKGDADVNDPLFFACHMDTVGPAKGIEVQRSGDIFTSKGDTILGADDKSGIAPLLELVSLLKEHSVRHCPVELVFTTCEEIGLMGAKALDTSLIQAQYGYALDSSRQGKIITGAPAANRLKITVRGRAAHSGLDPEAGINALAVAAKAINHITLGRVDSLSTTNFGLISGGTASNIVPELIVLEGEVRSHSPEMLKKHTLEITDIFERVAAEWPAAGEENHPRVMIETQEDFPVMRLEDNDPVLRRIQSATTLVGRPMAFDIAGGGSDANIFSARGLPTAIIPTGMSKVHSTEEQVDLNDMVELTELLLALVTDQT